MALVTSPVQGIDIVGGASGDGSQQLAVEHLRSRSPWADVVIVPLASTAMIKSDES